MKDLLLIVDMQNAYLPNQPWECANILDIIPKIKMLCENPNKSYDVVFTRFIASKNPVGTWNNYNKKKERPDIHDKCNSDRSIKRNRTGREDSVSGTHEIAYYLPHRRTGGLSDLSGK